MIEELRRLADGVVDARGAAATRRAQWHERAVDRGRTPRAHDPTGCSPKAARRTAACRAAFVVELLQWLRDQPVTAASTWQALHQRARGTGRFGRGDAAAEHQREAADQLAIGNVITSMRLVSSIDWTAFFERVSVVEQVLREDPAGPTR